MSLLPTIGAIDQDTGFYNGVATQSLRFDDGSSAYLTRTPSGAGNQKTWTFSTWLKRGVLNPQSQILSVGNTGAGSPWFLMYFADDDNLNVYWYTSGTVNSNQTFTPKFRDISAWYNIVLRMDTTQSTDTNRVKLYINGVEASHGNSQYPTENYDTLINGTSAHHIGRHGGGSYFDGYLAETIMLDGTSTDASSFGETKNGVWIPIDTSGLTFGTNGFRLEYKETSVGSGSSSTIGADTSGQNNHWTSSGIVADDCNMPDSPENNFPTWNSIAPDPTYGITTISEGNLKSLNSAASNLYSEITFQLDKTNKYYFEYYNIDATTPVKPASFELFASSTNKFSLYITNAGNIYVDGSSIGSSFPTLGAGDIVNIAYDGASGKIWLGKNGTYYNASGSATGNPADGSNPIATLTSAEFKMTSTFYQQGAIMNFGQDSTFAGNKTSGSENAQDSNGIGDFYDTVPSGFLALCSANLPEPTISPNADTQADDHFNAILYEGNGSPAQHTIGFRPNMVWGKKRLVNAQNHWLINDVTDIDKFMSPDTEDAESTTAGTTFNANGSFTTANNDLYVNNGSNYVVWAWKGNGTGTATSNTSGSINSTVSVNTDAGLSIVSYTGNGGGSAATVGHGLGVVPDMYIVKRRESGGTPNWAVYHKGVDDSVPQNYFMRLDTNVGRQASSTMWNNTAPTSSVFSIGTSNLSNNSQTFLALCFAEVEGYSRFGKYIGNGATSGTAGTFVYLGFRPKFVMLKLLGTGHWWILDSTRDPHNEALRALEADTNVIETGYSGNFLDFYSNGFAPRTSGSQVNGSGSGYIYMAFAENPFKYANAR